MNNNILKIFAIGKINHQSNKFEIDSPITAFDEDHATLALHLQGRAQSIIVGCTNLGRFEKNKVIWDSVLLPNLIQRN